MSPNNTKRADSQLRRVSQPSLSETGVLPEVKSSDAPEYIESATPLQEVNEISDISYVAFEKIGASARSAGKFRNENPFDDAFIGEVFVNDDLPPRDDETSSFFLNDFDDATQSPAQSGPAFETAPAISDEVMKALVASGLFLPDWYLESNPDLDRNLVDPIRHFQTRGCGERRNPNPLFDSEFYRGAHPDVAAAGFVPVAHYLISGEAEGRDPGPFFDAAWYRKRYAVQVAGGNALGHYVTHRHSGAYSPGPFFDAEFYLRRNPDIAQAKIDPFRHFMETGYKEGRDPSPDFRTVFYRRRYLGGRDDINPLSHYLLEGRKAGNFPAPGDPADRTQASEIKRFSVRSEGFEEFDPRIAANRPRLAKLVAFYLPQFHAFPENDKWWGKGFTEWSNIARGTPRFAGHYQPRVPRDLGFYDLNDPSVMARQIDMAKAAGIHGFCYYYYNFNGKRLMERPLDAFLADEALDFPFCLMWANENWTRRWDGLEAEVLIRQDYREEDLDGLIADFARHFRDPRYIRVGGRPLLFLYRPGVIPDGSFAVATWRERFRVDHGEDPLVYMVQGFGDNDPTEYGCDGAIEFPPHKLARSTSLKKVEVAPFDPEFEAEVFRYADIAAVSLNEAKPGFPLIKTVAPSWDNDARRQGKGMSLVDSSPAKYQAWLEGAMDFARKNPVGGEPLVFINAWNEWAEGAYLEPDVHFGGAYLNATARAAVGARARAGRQKIVLVGHDAHPHGAQLLLLHLARMMAREFGCELRIVLCGGGPLLGRYEEIAPTIVAEGTPAIKSAFRDLRAAGFRKAIMNSLASGHASRAAKAEGFRIACLIHELPRIVAELGIAGRGRDIAECADVTVFPSRIVLDGFAGSVGAPKGESVVRPQGLYAKIERIGGARESLREELGLPSDAQIVVNVGYGDMRKGFDIFCAVARTMRGRRPGVHFVWAGAVEKSLATWFDGKAANLHFLGQRTDVARILSASDVMALTSREDPFPSTVLEAMAVGLPCVGFEGGGGFVELLAESPIGRLAPFCDVSGMADAVEALLRDGVAQADRQTAIDHVAQRHSFRDYAFGLLQLVAPDLKRVSVVVPSYNYARYMPDRLHGIFDQTYPVYEVLLLDDASGDASVEAAVRIAAAAGRELRVVANDVNSGSVFKQWEKGARLAQGEFLWIAEADDASRPAFLAKVMAGFESPDVTMAFSDSAAIDNEGHEIWPSYKGYYAQSGAGLLGESLIEDSRAFASACLSERNLMVNVSAVVWRRDALTLAFETQAAALPCFKLAGDWLLYLEVCRQGGRIAYCADPLNVHRRNVSGVTNLTAMAEQAREITRLHAAYNQAFGDDLALQIRQQAYVDEIERRS